ncbi:hypothetical protein QQF64_007472 [Cirrhinus molitorella]|uniref:Uncharacterized protein n=1 Tax=Cirrhinus molitorella TaxID=172907 RepID=A0ABR3MAT7_9TELE
MTAFIARAPASSVTPNKHRRSNRHEDSEREIRRGLALDSALRCCQRSFAASTSDLEPFQPFTHSRSQTEPRSSKDDVFL